MKYLRNLYRGFLWWLLFVSLLITCLWGSWHLWAKFDFAYPQLYKWMEIEQHIDEFGPKNRYKNGFELTSKEERIELFSEIVNSIHHQGRGLDVMVYHTASDQPIDVLLREPEILHLTDVAHLIDQFNVASILAVLLMILLVIVIYWQAIPRPSTRNLVLMTLVPVAITAAVIMLIGPKKVFYQLHIWIFPDGHQWFFYYQESLMTTLMKAPDLFGYIALFWLGSGILVWTAIIVLSHLLRRLLTPAPKAAD